MKSLIGLMVLGLFISTSFRNAMGCEEHVNLESNAGSLPANSVYHLDSKWVNENNKSISLGHFSGRPRLVAMVYTKCQTACPLLVHDIKSILKEIPAAKRQELHVDLFSFESKSESAETLKKFKSKYKLDKSWSAYASSEDSVTELAAALGIQYKKLPSGEYIHSNVIFLLDKNGEVIAKQEGLAQDSANFVKKVLMSL